MSIKWRNLAIKVMFSKAEDYGLSRISRVSYMVWRGRNVRIRWSRVNYMVSGVSHLAFFPYFTLIDISGSHKFIVRLASPQSVLPSLVLVAPLFPAHV